MNRAAIPCTLGAFAAAVAMAFAAAAGGACNTQGSCPAKEIIQPGASCSDDQLQCAFDLATPSAACDGTTTIPSSCTCTKGAWSCPSAFACEGGAGDGGEDGPSPETGDDAPSDAMDGG